MILRAGWFVSLSAASGISGTYRLSRRAAVRSGCHGCAEGMIPRRKFEARSDEGLRRRVIEAGTTG